MPALIGGTINSGTIGTDAIGDTQINWGIGANQVNSDDMPDHNGHSVLDTFQHIINRGKSSAITVTLTGGLGISWTTGELYDQANNLFISTSTGSGNVTNNEVNYLKWSSGTNLTISTTTTSGNEILVSKISTYDGNINGHRETSLMSDTVANSRRGLRDMFPTYIISGMSVSEDTDVTNPLDVKMDAGVFWKDGIEKKTPVEIKTRTTAMVRHFHTSGTLDSDTHAEIDTANYDTGTDKASIPANKWVKSLFIFMNEKIGWVYPREYFTVKADALDAALPAIPTGLSQIPKLTAIVYQQGDANFTQTVWQDVRPGISEESFDIVTDHGALAGLSDDDHTQYLLADGTRGLSADWNGGSYRISSGTFGATTSTIYGDGSNITGIDLSSRALINGGTIGGGTVDGSHSYNLTSASSTFVGNLATFGGGEARGKKTISTSTATGGTDGDIWYVYTA